MKSEDFCYWLQGFVEMNPNAMLTHTQWMMPDVQWPPGTVIC